MSEALKEQALRVLLDADEAHEPEGSMWPELAEALIDAGWRPPDHVEATLRKTFRHYFISSNALFQGFEDQMAARWAEIAAEHIVAGCPFERVWGDSDV